MLANAKFQPRERLAGKIPAVNKCAVDEHRLAYLNRIVTRNPDQPAPLGQGTSESGALVGPEARCPCLVLESVGGLLGWLIVTAVQGRPEQPAERGWRCS
jgi:hypothetical protein